MTPGSSAGGTCARTSAPVDVGQAADVEAQRPRIDERAAANLLRQASKRDLVQRGHDGRRRHVARQMQGDGAGRHRARPIGVDGVPIDLIAVRVDARGSVRRVAQDERARAALLIGAKFQVIRRPSGSVLVV